MPDPDSISAFDTILSKADELRVPLWAHLDLTFRCNLKCVHCYCQGLKGKPWGAQELSSEEVRGILDSLAQAGSLYLTLSGGEVLLRPDFFDIARYAKASKFCLTIFTNGTLVDEKISDDLAGLSPLAIEMSIYGVDPLTHELITGKPGSFERLLEAVRLLKERGVNVILKSVIMKENFHQAGALSAFVKSLGADEYRFAIEIAPKNDGSREPQSHQLDKDQLYALLSVRDTSAYDAELLKGDPLDKPVCGTGSVSCYISPYGDVFPCSQFLLPMGNIREKSFKDIWRGDSKARELLSNVKSYRDMPSCRQCGYVRFCRKCIGMAYLEKEDIGSCYETLNCLSRMDCELSTKGVCNG